MADKRTTKKAGSKKAAVKQQASKKKPPTGLRLFYRETMGELRKVSWPTREEARALTGVVVLVMTIMAIILGGLDFAFFEFFALVFEK